MLLLQHVHVQDAARKGAWNLLWEGLEASNRCVCSRVHDRRAVGAVRRCGGREEDLLGQAAARAVLKVLHHLTSALGHHLATSAAASPAGRFKLGTHSHGPYCEASGKCNGR